MTDLGSVVAGSARGRIARDVLACLAVLVLGLAVALPRFRDGMDLLDEGHLAYGGVRVLAGELPHRDFESLQPPLSFWSAALVFELFGISLAPLRALGLGLHLVIALCLYAITRRFVAPLAALGAALPAAVIGLPFFLFVPFAVWHGVALGALALALLLRSGARPAWVAASGAASALALAARHDVGAYLVLSAALHAALRPRADRLWSCGRWGLGFAAVALPLAVYWLVSGALPAMFRQLVLFPWTTYVRSSTIPMPAFAAGETAGERVLSAAFYLPLLIQAATAVHVVLRRARGPLDARDRDLVVVLVWAALSYLQVLARSDLHHLVITLAPTFVLGAVGVDALVARLARRLGRDVGRDGGAAAVPRIAGFAWAGALLAVVLAGAAALARAGPTRDSFVHRPPLRPASLLPTYAEPGVEVPLARAGVRLQPADALFLGELVRLVQQHARADESILCLPYQPMLYFLAERRNPTRWNYLWPGDQSEDDHRRLVEQAQSDPPALVLLTDVESVRRTAPAVIDWVEQRYRPAGNLGVISFYLPRAPETR